MQAHQLPASKKGTRRIGRGGKRGSFSGRGIKGQKSRAGRRIRPQIRDILKKLHKRRGYGKNRGRSVIGTITKTRVINVNDINKAFPKGGHIAMPQLIEFGFVKKGQLIKILGTGLLNKNITLAKDLTLSLSLHKKLGIK